MGELKVSASIMCGNPLKFGEELDKLENSGADFIHFDMMDGHYVENIAMGLYMLKAMKGRSTIPFDVHLAMFKPERYLAEIASYGAEYVYVHPESTTHFHRVVKQMQDLGIKPGVALNPATSEEILEYVIEEVDAVLNMTVSPGFAGQKFIPKMTEKIKAIREMANKRNPDLMIVVDGNINDKTIPSCIENGADVLVLGTSSIFKGEGSDYKKSITDIKEKYKNMMR